MTESRGKLAEDVVAAEEKNFEAPACASAGCGTRAKVASGEMQPISTGLLPTAPPLPPPPPPPPLSIAASAAPVVPTPALPATCPKPCPQATVRRSAMDISGQNSATGPPPPKRRIIFIDDPPPPRGGKVNACIQLLRRIFPFLFFCSICGVTFLKG